MSRALLRPSPLLLSRCLSKTPRTLTQCFLQSPLGKRKGITASVARGPPRNAEDGGKAQPLEHVVDDGPTWISLEAIDGEEQFDRIVAEAQPQGVDIVVLWMANWCRKCIYLKPKLEKLAAEYYPTIRFYSVDVNSVSRNLVNRAGITKMPTIQLWKDCKKQDEVIGGNKAWLIANDVRQMLENQG